jgi:hypothetical protein
MLNILEKLTTRRSERQKQNAASWSQFVVDVADERLKDADEILLGLERLNKTPEQLVEACELLARRRGWAVQVAAGDKAEAGYSGLQQQMADAEKELEALIEAHQKKQMPLQNKIEKARAEMSTGSDAKRRLQETAGKATREAAFDTIEAELEQARKELAPLSKLVADRKRWLATVHDRGQSAATEDQENLQAMKDGYTKMLADEAAATRRIHEIQSRHNEAFQQLLKPEAI